MSVAHNEQEKAHKKGGKKMATDGHNSKRGHNKREKHAKENGMSKEEIEKEIYELKERFNIVKMRLEREYQR